MIWSLAHRYDPASVAIADRHYSRQKPGTPQCMPPGSNIVLKASTPLGIAVWGTSWPKPEYTHHAWAGAWVCSLFRNEGAGRSSRMIREAVAATRFHFGEPPALGMVTFVNTAKVRAKRDPGHCFIIAGFRPVGFTERRGLLVLQFLPDRMPPASPAIGAQMELLAS